MAGLEGERILLAHGDGGLLTHRLVSGLFLKYFGMPSRDMFNDSAVIDVPAGRLAFTTDSFVVNPVFFPGGDIGKLAVCGTVNDLAVAGAEPRHLCASFILEEGLLMSRLERIVASMAETARTACVSVVAGDTKVVERGQADSVYINTSGIGLLPEGLRLGHERVTPGDVLIINGSIGDHGIAVLSRRPGVSFESPVKSDCAPLNHLIKGLLERFKTIKLMRDPTRGGLGTTVKEMALGCRLDIVMDEKRIPVGGEVAGAAEMLGLDPLYLANEGKVVIIAGPGEGESLVEHLRAHPLGMGSGIIGEVRQGGGDVYLKTALGGTRLVDMLSGGQLPRIC